MTKNSLISILHVSDFHYSKRKLREQSIVIESLVNDLEGICQGHRRPDVVLFTGDLVDRAGIDSHLDAFDSFISKISVATGCSDERIFIVPGNHDAQQASVKSNFELLEYWRGHSNDIDKINILYDEDKFGGHSDETFRQFFELEEYLSRGALRYRNSFASVFHIESLNFDIVVINSALLSSAGFSPLGDDERQLIVPEYAIRDALENLTPDSFRIFATHHPLTMLSEAGESYLRGGIQKDANIHLFGHKHALLTEIVNSFEGEVYSGQAAAIFTTRKKAHNGYSLI